MGSKNHDRLKSKVPELGEFKNMILGYEKKKYILFICSTWVCTKGQLARVRGQGSLSDPVRVKIRNF